MSTHNFHAHEFCTYNCMHTLTQTCIANLCGWWHVTDQECCDHADDCWVMEVGGGGESVDLEVSWMEVDLAYDHGLPRCWHTAAVEPPGLLYIHSGLTQPYYISMFKLIVIIAPVVFSSFRKCSSFAYLEH